MKRYDSYKVSGVEWMNKIPSNWEKSRIRMVGDLYGGLTGKKGSDFNDEDNLSNKPFVPFTNIFNNTYISKDHFQYVNVEENENQNRVLKNDLFFLMSSESYEDLGKSSILLEDVEELYLNSFCKGFRIKDSKVYPLFLNYQLLGSLHKEMISIEGNGFTRINLRQDRLLDIPVFIPPLHEQQQIVSFLDTKTSHIDSLIEKTQQKIELLKEKRTSLINEVVTKGLNPNVEMKDSGVEWIGEIPSHWELRKGSTIGNYSKGKGIKKDEVRETGLPCIRYGEIYTKYNHKFERVETFIDEGITDVKVSKGTLFMTGSGELLEDIGKCLVYVGEEELYVGGDIIILKSFSEFDSEFLSYQINSECIRIQREINGRGGIIVHIYSKNFKDMWFPTPSLSEQQQIVEYLDEQTQLIDNTISLEEKRIELLNEYRQSLISEVVTGKRKVV